MSELFSTAGGDGWTELDSLARHGCRSAMEGCSENRASLFAEPWSLGSCNVRGCSTADILGYHGEYRYTDATRMSSRVIL